MQPKPTHQALVASDDGVPAESGGATAAHPLLELLATRDRATPSRIDGVVIGVVDGVSSDGRVLVDFEDNGTGAALPARTLVAVGANEIGREVALMFEGGDPTRPLVMGLMHVPTAPPAPAEAEAEAEAEADRDVERLVFEAGKEIVLRCGKASITLTRSGKVVIKGAYLLARSSGVNRIQGGSVQIN